MEKDYCSLKREAIEKEWVENGVWNETAARKNANFLDWCDQVCIGRVFSKHERYLDFIHTLQNNFRIVDFADIYHSDFYECSWVVSDPRQSWETSFSNI